MNRVIKTSVKIDINEKAHVNLIGDYDLQMTYVIFRYLQFYMISVHHDVRHLEDDRHHLQHHDLKMT